MDSFTCSPSHQHLDTEVLLSPVFSCQVAASRRLHTPSRGTAARKGARGPSPRSSARRLLARPAVMASRPV